MVALPTVLSSLASIVGDRAYPYLPDATQFSVDGQRPQAAVEPVTYDEVASVIRYANENGLAVVPWGGGLHMHIGNVPRRYDIGLSLARLNQIVEYEPADMTVTCQAGMPVPLLQEHLRNAGQAISIDARPSHQPSVGGMLAANAYGPLRDITIGMRVVTADGRITRAGGKVVKNVAGYDLCKLYIGSLGTLGVIVEATFKVMPAARAKRRILLTFPAPGDACSVAGEIHRRGLGLSQAQLRGLVMEPDPLKGRTIAWFLELGLAGSDRGVERAAIEIDRLAARFQANPISEGPAPGPGSIDIYHKPEGWVICRIRSLPSQLPGIIEQLRETEWAEIEADPAVGTMRVYWRDVSDADATVNGVREIAARHAATCVIEHCSAELKRRIDIFGELPPSFELMRRIKQEFDSNGTLSPGRFVGRL